MKRIITRHEIMGWFRSEYSMFPVQDIEGLFKGLSDWRFKGENMRR